MTGATSRATSNASKPLRQAKEAIDAERASQARLLAALLTLVSLDPGADARSAPAREEPVERALERSRHGTATRGDSLALVCEQCSIGELMLRLRELGLDARGTKHALAARLLDVDPAFAQSRFSRAPRDLLQCLRERDLDAAIELAIAQPMSARVDANASIAWRKPDRRRDMTLLLRRVFTTWPDALDDVPDASRGAYRVAASMMALSASPCRAEWIDARGPMRSRRSGVQTTTLVLRAAQLGLRRERWRDAGITHARIAFAGTPCAACCRLHDRIYSLRRLPSLPPAECTGGDCSPHLIAYRRTRARIATLA